MTKNNEHLMEKVMKTSDFPVEYCFKRDQKYKLNS